MRMPVTVGVAIYSCYEDVPEYIPDDLVAELETSLLCLAAMDILCAERQLNRLKSMVDGMP